MISVHPCSVSSRITAIGLESSLKRSPRRLIGWKISAHNTSWDEIPPETKLHGVFLVPELLHVTIALELFDVLDRPQERRDTLVDVQRLRRTKRIESST